MLSLQAPKPFLWAAEQVLYPVERIGHMGTAVLGAESGILVCEHPEESRLETVGRKPGIRSLMACFGILAAGSNLHFLCVEGPTSLEFLHIMEILIA